MPPPPAPPVAPMKHRACDECRTRKLACSKDDGGCARCKRENIVCHYSEQKPMGRPRKRQFIESTEPATTLDTDPFELNTTLPTAKQTESYINTAPSDAFFMNENPQADIPNLLDPQLYSQRGIPYSKWHFGGSSIGGPPINYGDIPVESETSPASFDSAPQLSNGSTSDSSSSPPQMPQIPCGCLASMYLSLAALQQLPSESITALKAVRGAAQVAANSIWCPQCGSIAVDNPNPPIEAFQNTMLLGTILPIIANGYQKLLRIIDDETNAADAAGQTKTFRFLDYGGLCGHQASIQEAMACVEKELMFKEVEMPAHQWRTTVRALLRIDIYGHEQGGFKHKGLKDLLTEMEIRQKARHDMLDQHHAAGLLGHGIFNQNCVAREGEIGMPSSGYTCLQILHIAKLSIDNLVIA